MEVKVLLDSINPYTGVRLTTLYCVYPQFVHQQVLTHRMFSRNSSSLRAISFNRAINEFEIVYPTWTLEKKGMTGDLVDDENLVHESNCVVNEMYKAVVHYCQQLTSLGIHHQDINNYLRVFQPVHTVITATDWDNFFEQRLHESTKPDMQRLAQLIKEALDTSESVERYYHIPMVNDHIDIEHEYIISQELTSNEIELLAAARLARISYFKWQDDPHKDLELAKKLLRDKHLSPFEHIAFAQDSYEYFANFKSWKQLRHTLS